MILNPVVLLTSRCLRRVGLAQTVHIGMGAKYECEKGNVETPGQRRPIEPSKVRNGFIPEEWFTFFYSKTGVTGPYMFGLGLLNYLFSKEIYVCDHEFYSGLALAIMCVVAVKKLGPITAKFCDKEIEKVEKDWKKMHEAEIKYYQDLIESEKKAQWRAEGSLMLLDVKKANIALQLEAAYREALNNVYVEIIQKLDHQVACRNVVHRIGHKHRINWIVKSVVDAMPQTDERTRKKHLADVFAMALRYKE